VAQPVLLTVVVSPTSVATGGTVTVVWSGIAIPTPKDWIGLWDLGTPTAPFLKWMYTNCSMVAGTAGRAAGSCVFPVGTIIPGHTYQLRLHPNDSEDPAMVLKSSNTITGR
jgi:hypothetical protein